MMGTVRKRCRCAHHRRAHSGRSTECRGEAPDGRNAAGVKMWLLCDCKTFRPTERSWLRRLWDSTEEDPRMVGL